jgi:uncharacterized DUF497 family protein
MKFAWDPRKEATHLAKRGVPSSEAEQAFSDTLAAVAFDDIHSPRGESELRWRILGKVGARVMLARYTHRPNGVIRIIGAGYREIGAKIFEEKNKAD